MSQTYMHYSTSSSLPSDYALLSRYAAARGLDENANTIASDEEVEVNNHDTGELHYRWLVSKAFSVQSRMRETLQFLLDHPRRCFITLFPSHQTWLLLFVLLAMK